MAEFLKLLISLSEKAANLARVIRSEHALFELLVEEKTGDAKNKRFVQDFKTLADVLIQEMIKHDVSEKFPEMKEHIYGEESNLFTNTLGESIAVGVQSTQEETAQLLGKVLDGNTAAANILAKVIHQELDEVKDEKVDKLVLELDMENFAIWIDPIDSTSEYIKGISDNVAENGVHSCGLECSTVLIGVYDRNTGLPVIGVINQPFAQLDKTTAKWQGRPIWGVCWKDIRANSYSDGHDSQERKSPLAVVLSSSEQENIKSAVAAGGKGRYQYASGAGYKALCVSDKLVDAYILSKGTTFKWDCCAPHAILTSMGGGIVDLKKAMQCGDDGACLNSAAIHYDKPDSNDYEPGQKWANSGGMIAYWSEDAAKEILKLLQTHKL
ncbi:inositol polyphosphate 1-phosphatase-like [Ptychodera flava]|uniref:inositol polyphosphate 1-phosphatase-like n=1 Tax=Ptychodera flava TaxID=63121 RepID=UPI00396A3B42